VLAPRFRAARYRHAQVLFELNKPAKAAAEIDVLLKDNPDNPECLSLKAVALTAMGEYEAALACHERLVRAHPGRPGFRLNYASDLRAAGRQEDAIAAYREALARFPGLVEAWWGLGNLKTYRFAPEDVAAMEKLLAEGGVSERERSLLHFTLGKAFEDTRDFARSFTHYENANALRRAAMPHDADRVTRDFARLKQFFSPDFFATHAGLGCERGDPIFVVGLPRAGSSLVTQILSSHPEIEATAELGNIDAIAGRLEGAYPDSLADLDPGAFEALGEEYLDDTRALRTLARRFFVDKMPGNFRHAGLIHLILPNAKIVDVRRHPLACGFSNFKQDFEAGYGFANGLADFGRYWRDYAGLMDHWDAVLPGKVHRLHYERLVEDPEGEIRRLLGRLGLAFDERCLRFHENRRAIRTASSEQVRTPLFRDALDQWRNYEPWLGPLKAALGGAFTKDGER